MEVMDTGHNHHTEETAAEDVAAEDAQTPVVLPELPVGKQSEEGSCDGRCILGSDYSSMRVWNRTNPTIPGPDSQLPRLLSCVSQMILVYCAAQEV